ncbi:UvrD-helicase domain-containing protein [Polluticaenibacter yanchengensis]|uniref:DNA 3'-5' helicase n=1 Tax=Polluticaenibacter yanchengensis TaxID=3014562 RepID=A0ABT4UH21_9BACT|nr:UvrD-helicase domain-containing protein [Chitinophagaceae bacterium LY-5]
MKNTVIWLGILFFPLGIYLLYKWKKKRDAVKEENQRQETTIYVNTILPEVSNANYRFENLLNYESGYFNNNKLKEWQLDVGPIYSKLATQKVDVLHIESDIVSVIDTLKTNYEQGEKIRTERNEAFMQHELKECDHLFSNIDNASLDEQQRLAIVRDEDNNLVIAGAGSGKTTTVAGKVTYLIERLKVLPDEILLITFTKKASDEMKERIKQKMGINLEVNTFHSFGRKIIGNVTKNMPSVIEDKEYSKYIRKIFGDLMVDTKYLNNVIKFLTEYKLEEKDNKEFEDHGEYIEYIKDNEIKSYKTIEKTINGRTTLLREVCKSLEEVKIANYLFLNGVKYKYEEPYQHSTSDSIYAQYKPDFYLPDYDIYIEHFGLIDKENNVPSWFAPSGTMTAKEKYNADIEWKRNKHKEHETCLVETYSYENREDVLLENLKEKLEKHKVIFKPRSAEEVWDLLNDVAKEDVSAFDTLINTFLTLFKSGNIDIGSLNAQVEKMKVRRIRKRNFLFISIFEPILNEYNAYLRENNLIDFSDMINEATRYIKNHQFNNTFKYIIIDEFQDTSIGRFSLIKALLDNNKCCKLFAVGDDWQSIYRFAGSDISLFTEFESYFGKTALSKIETTYRFSKAMIDLSSEFILANPNQTPKSLRPFTVSAIEPIEILYSNSHTNDDPLPLIEALTKINAENAERKGKVKIIALSRYNHFINLYKNRRDLFSVVYNPVEKNEVITYLPMPHLSVEFLTVHRSKGLQADYTILLHCVSGKNGFPSEQADDPLLNLLLSKADQFPNGEERRLFYVALTRAKKKTFITTSVSNKSKFVREIDPNDTVITNPRCPKCKRGEKVRNEGINKYGRPYIRYTCSNWNFDCDYVEWGKVG